MTANLRAARLASLVYLALAGGCATSSYTSESVLLGDSGQRIELTGFAFQTSEQGDMKTVTFAEHRAVFEPERIVIDGNQVWTGPYRRAAVSRGKAATVVLTVDGKRVPVGAA